MSLTFRSIWRPLLMSVRHLLNFLTQESNDLKLWMSSENEAERLIVLDYHYVYKWRRKLGITYKGLYYCSHQHIYPETRSCRKQQQQKWYHGILVYLKLAAYDYFRIKDKFVNSRLEQWHGPQDSGSWIRYKAQYIFTDRLLCFALYIILPSEKALIIYKDPRQ